MPTLSRALQLFVILGYIVFCFIKATDTSVHISGSDHVICVVTYVSGVDFSVKEFLFATGCINGHRVHLLYWGEIVVFVLNILISNLIFSLL